VALSRLTREGPGKLFHLCPFRIAFGNGCDCPAMSPAIVAARSPDGQISIGRRCAGPGRGGTGARRGLFTDHSERLLKVLSRQFACLAGSLCSLRVLRVDLRKCLSHRHYSTCQPIATHSHFSLARRFSLCYGYLVHQQPVHGPRTGISTSGRSERRTPSLRGPQGPQTHHTMFNYADDAVHTRRLHEPSQ
jgi:hypothetical protein